MNFKARRFKGTYTPNGNPKKSFKLKQGCKHLQSTVIDTRPVSFDNIRRRRVCLKCGKRWTTIEMDAHEANDLLAIAKFSSEFNQEFERIGYKRKEFKYLIR